MHDIISIKGCKYNNQRCACSPLFYACERYGVLNLSRGSFKIKGDILYESEGSSLKQRDYLQTLD